MTYIFKPHCIAVQINLFSKVKIYYGLQTYFLGEENFKYCKSWYDMILLTW